MVSDDTQQAAPSPSPPTPSLPRSKGVSPTQPPADEHQTAAGPTSAAWDSPQTMLAIQAIQRHSREGGSTPSLGSILAAYSSDGEGDLELLKALLFAKAREDERMAAYDMVRVEQMRAANAQAAAYQQQYWFAQQQQHSYAPSSPISPRTAGEEASAYAWSSQGHAGTPTIAVSTPADGTNSNSKRGHSSTADDPSGKKHRSEKLSHEQVMMALRARCERNRAEARSTSSRSRSSSSSSSSNLPSNHHLQPSPITATKSTSDERSTRSTGSRAYPSPPPRLRALDPLPTSGVLPPMSSMYPSHTTTMSSSRVRRSISEEASRSPSSSNSSTLSRLLNAVDVASAYAKTSDVRSSPGDTEEQRAVSV